MKTLLKCYIVTAYMYIKQKTRIPVVHKIGARIKHVFVVIFIFYFCETKHNLHVHSVS